MTWSMGRKVLCHAFMKLCRKRNLRPLLKKNNNKQTNKKKNKKKQTKKTQKTTKLQKQTKHDKIVWIYQGDATITKHSLPEAPKEGEMRNKAMIQQTSLIKLSTHEQRRISTDELPWNGYQKYYWQLQPVLLALNLTYLQIISVCSARMHKGPLPHQWNITVKSIEFIRLFWSITEK